MDRASTHYQRSYLTYVCTQMAYIHLSYVCYILAQIHNKLQCTTSYLDTNSEHSQEEMIREGECTLK